MTLFCKQPWICLLGLAALGMSLDSPRAAAADVRQIVSPVSHDCPCERSSVGVPALLPGYGEPNVGPFLPQPAPPLGYLPPADWHGPPLSAVRPVQPRVANFGPPPGTLGRTYRVRTLDIPSDRHPRVGMLDVYVPQDLLIRQGLDDRHYVRASIDGLNGFIGDDGNWHFESDPLIPGVPHVYNVRFDVVRIDRRIEQRYGRQFETEVETKLEHLGYRTVRLIPGRVVELRY